MYFLIHEYHLNQLSFEKANNFQIIKVISYNIKNLVKIRVLKRTEAVHWRLLQRKISQCGENLPRKRSEKKEQERKL